MFNDEGYRNAVLARSERKRDEQQPAPNDGEWSLSSAEVNAIMTKRLTGQTAVPLTCVDLPKHYGAIVVLDGPETAAQIVADHHAVSRLVEVLYAILAEAEFVGDAKQPFSTWVAEKCRTALAATTTPPDAGEGR